MDATPTQAESEEPQILTGGGLQPLSSPAPPNLRGVDPNSLRVRGRPDCQRVNTGGFIREDGFQRPFPRLDDRQRPGREVGNRPLSVTGHSSGTVVQPSSDHRGGGQFMAINQDRLPGFHRLRVPKHPRITRHGLHDKTTEGDNPGTAHPTRNSATHAEIPSRFHGLENLGKPCAQDNGIDETEPPPRRPGLKTRAERDVPAAGQRFEKSRRESTREADGLLQSNPAQGCGSAKGYRSKG